MLRVFDNVADCGAHTFGDGILEGFFAGEPLGELVVRCFGDVQFHTGRTIVDRDRSRWDEARGQDGISLSVNAVVGRIFRPLLIREED